MIKNGIWMAAMMMAVSLQVVAQTDVTAQYVANPSFESNEISSLSPVNNDNDGLRGYTLASPAGWTVSGTSVTSLLVTANCFTDNNFGKVTTLSDGTKAYYLRQGWSGGTTTLKQVLTELKKGKYKLQVAVRSAYANTASSSLRLSAGGTSENFSEHNAGGSKRLNMY